MVYIFDNLSKLPQNWLEQTLPFLPFQRQNKILSYKQKKDRINMTLGYILLFFGLRKEYNITDLPVFEYKKNGKPYLKDYPNIYFNISHCRCCVACAISNKDVGLDVQDIRPVSNHLIKRVCNETEQIKIFNSKDKNAEFASIWSVKESVGKLCGCGIATNLKMLTLNNRLVKYNIQIQKRGNYFITVAYHKN